MGVVLATFLYQHLLEGKAPNHRKTKSLGVEVVGGMGKKIARTVEQHMKQPTP